jgi:DNA-binding NarL/FixJ family response regulator
MRLLVVDDHPLMAEAISLVLGSLEHQAQVETARDLQSALRIADTPPAFHAVLLDLGLPGCSGLQALERFRERFPALPVVVISASGDPRVITGALDLGAMGFIPKSSPKDVILNAVRLVVSGGVYIPVQALSLRGEEPPPAAPPPTPRTSAQDLGLSPRQAEVLTLVLKGLPNKLIARKLDISENTTKAHVSAVLKVLGVATRTQALIAASRLGLRLEN